MKTLPNNSKVVLAAAVLTVLFASGCERHTPADSTGSATSSGSSTMSPPPASTAPSNSTATGGKTAGTAIDDTVITTKVKAALVADSDIKSLDVKVVTSNGTVTLNGEVNNQTQIDRVVKIASGVDGVGSVVNNLTIKKQ